MQFAAFGCSHGPWLTAQGKTTFKETENFGVGSCLDHVCGMETFHWCYMFVEWRHFIGVT